MIKWNARIDVRLHKVLARLPDDCTANLKSATLESGDILFRDMAARVPERTGALRRAIGFKMSNSGLTAMVGFSKSVFPADWKEAGWRAHWTEFGTAPTSGGGLTKAASRGGMFAKGVVRVKRAHARTPARPFVLPALRANIREIIATQTAAVQASLARAAA